MIKAVFSLTFQLCCYVHLAFSNIEYDGHVFINLQHNLVPENPTFTERGNVTIQSLRLGQSVVNQNPLSPADHVKLAKLAANNDFYQLRSTVTSNDGSQLVFLSTVKACMLAEAELNDILSVSLDYSGRIIGVTLAVAATSTCEGAVVPPEQLTEFSTTVFVRHATNGPIPDTATYVRKLEMEREARERGDVKDNRSFLAKYWMYMIPIVIVMVLSSAANPDAAGGGAQR